MKSKTELRKIIINNRKCKTNEIVEKSSEKALKTLINDKIFKDSKVIGIYFPIKNEINLMELLNLFEDKVFALPVITENSEMIYAKIDKNTKFEEKNFGVFEPVILEDITDEIDLLIVPALAINQNNYRLGYGKGYFDKFLSNRKSLYTIGIIYEEELYDFDNELHDIALKKIIKG